MKISQSTMYNMYLIVQIEVKLLYIRQTTGQLQYMIYSNMNSGYLQVGTLYISTVCHTVCTSYLQYCLTIGSKTRLKEKSILVSGGLPSLSSIARKNTYPYMYTCTLLHIVLCI